MKKQLLLTMIIALAFLCVAVMPVAAADVAGTAPAARADKASVFPMDISISAISPTVSEVGKISWSIDGLGINPASTGTIQVEKPAGATVKSAYMAAATTGYGRYKLAAGDIKIDGVNVVFTKEIANDISSYNYWGDVTSLVQAKIDAAPAGRVDFTITEGHTSDIDGELLVVIFNDPAQTTDNTVLLMFGAQKKLGDDFNIGLSEPLNLADPKLGLDFSLASTYSYQNHAAQYSIVDVNGVRMTSSAGGADDAAQSYENGNLFTVGGLDDSTANPVNALFTPGSGDDTRYDDELYTLLPFVKTGDTQIKVHTQNPSNDDNLMFAGLFVRSATAIVGEGILLSPASAENPLHTTHTVTAKVQDDSGNAVPGKSVTITVVSGPNAGKTGTGLTDASGLFSFTYTGDVVGTDVIEATFMDSTGKIVTSSQVTKKWTDSIIPAPEFPTVVVPLGLIGLVGLFVVASRRW